MHQQHRPGRALSGMAPIENLWGWMEQQPDREGINNTDDLQERLVTIRDAITLEQCRDLVGGMNNIMQQVVKLQGGHIGK